MDVCHQKCHRCNLEIMYEVGAVDCIEEGCLPLGWWLVWPEWGIPEYSTLELICNACYRPEDSKQPSHAIQNVPPADDAHIVDCSEGQGPGGRVMWEHAVVDGKPVQCR